MFRMKIVLACLMCLVLGASECFAIDGGPFGGGSTRVSVTGRYAGVLVPIPIVPDPSMPDVTLPPDNSLALFTLIVPQTGLATGTSAVFRNGIAYSGDIQGSADPDSAKLTGIIRATFFQISFVDTGTTGTAVTIESEYDANGQFLNAKIAANASASSVRIRGKAKLTYRNLRSDGGTPDPNGESGGPIDYKIHAFKQFDTTTTG
jgi:hypothetical protein